MKTDWREAAKCKDNTEIEFFPEKGSTGIQAKKFCAGCRVTEQCLDYALKNDIEFGVWGGLSAIQRHHLSRRLARQS
jgi:WhiB family redox-sensing transcriptional regulator